MISLEIASRYTFFMGPLVTSISQASRISSPLDASLAAPACQDERSQRAAAARRSKVEAAADQFPFRAPTLAGGCSGDRVARVRTGTGWTLAETERALPGTGGTLAKAGRTPTEAGLTDASAKDSERYARRSASAVR